MNTVRAGCCSFAAAFTLAAACGHPVPASSPLTKAEPQPSPSVRPSSTRAAESGEGTESKDVEKGDGGSTGTDDDDSTSVNPGVPLSTRGECRPPSKGPELDCGRLPHGSATCMGQVLAHRVCETVGPSLDPRIGSAWLACMREKTDKSRECETGRIFECGLKAIEGACVDGSQRAACKEIAKNCSEFAPEVTAAVCERALGAWKPERRDFLLQCLRRACDVGDFGACLP